MNYNRMVIDTGTSQRTLDFALARQQGWEACYVKLGGDNVGRYVAPYYVSQVDRARAAGMRVGHYWVPANTRDPVAAADYFVDNLRGWTANDFAVLDNESLDGAVRYSDSQAAVWVERVKTRLRISGKQVKTYSGLADARGTNWPAVLGTGTQFIIAAYSYPAGQIPAIPTIPANRIDGHQYGGSAIANGVITDTNVFADTAFDYSGTAGPTEEDDMPKAKLFRSDTNRGGNGDIRIVNMETGLDHGISDMNDLDLYIRLGWFDGVTTSTPINVMPHEMIRIRLIASQARGGVSVDAAAVARELSGTVAAAVTTALAEVEFDGDAAAIAAKVDQILADDFAKVNANIDDQPTTFDITPS